MAVKAKKKIPELKIRESTPLSRAMANPFLRFFLAGTTALTITAALFIFMIYITDNFTDYSNNASETAFMIQTIVLEDEGQRPERVQKPEELIDLMQGGDGIVDKEQVFENDEIPIEEWQRMFPGQVINDNTNEDDIDP